MIFASLLLLFNAVFAVRVAVIGAGVGGSSFAFWLKKSIPDVEITIFEKGDRIGGRVLDFKFQNQTVEIGANLIILENLYFKEVSEQFGLQKNMFKQRPANGPGGFWNGKEFTFAESDWFISNVFNGLTRFGYSTPSAVKTYVSDFLGRFTKIYDLLNAKKAFKTPEDLLLEVNLLDATTRSFREELRLMLNIGEGQPFPNFVDDIVGGVLKCNYASDFSVNGLVGLVSTAPIAVGSESAWNVQGGNKQLPTKALGDIQASIRFKTTVKEIVDDESSVKLRLVSGAVEEFDYVAIATPLPLANLKLDGKSLKAGFEMIHLHVTFIHGRLNGAFFGVSQNYIESMESILVPESVNLEFNSIGKQAIDKDNPRFALYKVFSMKPLSEKFSRLAFLQVKETFKHEIDAYPQYDGPVKTWTPFQLSQRVFYLNALETAMSAMEVSLVGARNVANLMQHRLKLSNLDSEEQDNSRMKSEL